MPAANRAQGERRHGHKNEKGVAQKSPPSLSELTDQFTACGISLAPSAITRLLGKISDI